jgi:hypothetical protein
MPIYNQCPRHGLTVGPLAQYHSWYSCTLASRPPAPCSLGLSATRQQYFSLRTNQPPVTSQQYFSLRTNQHQPSATSQTNRLFVCTTYSLVYILQRLIIILYMPCLASETTCFSGPLSGALQQSRIVQWRGQVTQVLCSMYTRFYDLCIFMCPTASPRWTEQSSLGLD